MADLGFELRMAARTGAHAFRDVLHKVKGSAELTRAKLLQVASAFFIFLIARSARVGCVLRCAVRHSACRVR